MKDITNKIVKDFERELAWLDINKKPAPISEVHVHSYTRYSPDGFVIERYERIGTPKDTPCEYHNGTLTILPNFYGAWKATPGPEVDKLNKGILEKMKKHRASVGGVTIDTSKVDASGLDDETRMKLALQQAYMILQKKIKEKEEKENAQKRGNDGLDK